MRSLEFCAIRFVVGNTNAGFPRFLRNADTIGERIAVHQTIRRITPVGQWLVRNTGHFAHDSLGWACCFSFPSFLGSQQRFSQSTSASESQSQTDVESRTLFRQASVGGAFSDWRVPVTEDDQGSAVKQRGGVGTTLWEGSNLLSYIFLPDPSAIGLSYPQCPSLKSPNSQRTSVRLNETFIAAQLLNSRGLLLIPQRFSFKSTTQVSLSPHNPVSTARRMCASHIVIRRLP